MPCLLAGRWAATISLTRSNIDLSWGCWFWSLTRYKEKFGRRMLVIAILRQTLSVGMVGFNSEDKQLAFRVKKHFVERWNFTTRGQSSRKVRFFVMHPFRWHSYFIELDLLFGHIHFRAICQQTCWCNTMQSNLLRYFWFGFHVWRKSALVFVFQKHEDGSHLLLHG